MADKKLAKKAAPKSVSKLAKDAPKKADYKKMTESELVQVVTSLRQDVIVLRRGTVMGEVQNVHAYTARRKELARALTALNTPREVK